MNGESKMEKFRNKLKKSDQVLPLNKPLNNDCLETVFAQKYKIITIIGAVSY